MEFLQIAYNMKRQHWIKLLTFKYSISEIVDWFRAYFRFYCYYHKNFTFLLRPYIREQIDFRIDVMMDKDCYNLGYCKVCGCETPALQMADKPCEGNCYPKIVNRQDWEFFKWGGCIFDEHFIWKNKRLGNYFPLDAKNYITKMEVNNIE